MSRLIAQLHVFAISPRNSSGWLSVGHRIFPCIIGKMGRTRMKHEGDNKSPCGRWRLLTVFFRSDKAQRPKTNLNTRALRQDDGWCDAKGHKDYNRHVRLPFRARHETLWRTDEAYNLLVTTNYNQRPRVQGAGSAIFLHIWRNGAVGTEGCVALRAGDLSKVLAACSKKALIII